MDKALKREIQVKGWNAFDEIFAYEKTLGTDLDAIAVKMTNHFSEPENHKDLSLLMRAIVHAESDKLEFMKLTEKFAKIAETLHNGDEISVGFNDIEEFNEEECKDCPDYEYCKEKTQNTEGRMVN